MDNFAQLKELIKDQLEDKFHIGVEHNVCYTSRTLLTYFEDELAEHGIETSPIMFGKALKEIAPEPVKYRGLGETNQNKGFYGLRPLDIYNECYDLTAKVEAILLKYGVFDISAKPMSSGKFFNQLSNYLPWSQAVNTFTKELRKQGLPRNLRYNDGLWYNYRFCKAENTFTYDWLKAEIPKVLVTVSENNAYAKSERFFCFFKNQAAKQRLTDFPNTYYFGMLFIKACNEVFTDIPLIHRDGRYKNLYFIGEISAKDSISGDDLTKLFREKLSVSRKHTQLFILKDWYDSLINSGYQLPSYSDFNFALFLYLKKKLNGIPKRVGRNYYWVKLKED